MESSRHRLPAETDALLEQLEESVARLALVLRSSASDAETQIMDEEALAWVRQSIEDIAATLRGLSLKHPGTLSVEAPLHTVSGPA